MVLYIINQYAVPLKQAGSTRHYILATELVKMGHQVYIFASSFDHVTRQETRLTKNETWKKEQIDGVNFIWLHTPAYSGNSLARIWNMLSFFLTIRKGIKKYRITPPQVVIGSSPHLFAALAAQLLAARYKVPFVLEVRDLWPQSLIDIGNISSRHPLVKILERIEKRLYAKAVKVISLLPGALNHMAVKGVTEEKFFWLPNGIDLNLVPAPKQQNDSGIINVMYAGTHGLANALGSIIKAAELIQANPAAQHIRFIFIGDGPDKPNLMQEVAKRNIKNVIFKDPVSKERIYTILQEADIFIITLKNISLYRFGISLNKIYDYLAMARPIVFGGNTCNDLIQAARAGITVKPEDAGAMAAAVLELARLSPEDRWQMGLKGRQYVEQHFDFKKLAVRLHELLEKIQ